MRTWESGWIVLASFVLGCADGRAPALVDAAGMDETTGPDIAPDPGTPSDAGPEEARDSSTRCGRVPFPGDPTAGHVTVFQGGLEGHPVYRIPAAATTITGALVVVVEARTSLADPGAGHIVLAMKRSLDCGATWTSPELVAENGDGDAHNPVLLDIPDGEGGATLFLFFGRRPASAGGEFDLPPGTGPDSATVWVRTSGDDGATWSEPREITAQVKPPDWRLMSPGPGGALVTRWGTPDAAAGRIVVPGWYTDASGEGSFVILSDDGGATFRLGGRPRAVSNECQAVELADGTLVLDARQNTAVPTGSRRVFRSRDGGETWSAPEAGLPMTRIMSGVARQASTRDGDPFDRLVHSGVGPQERVDVRVWVSLDEGATWMGETLLNHGVAQYSIPVRLDDGTMGLLYEGVGASGDAIGPTIVFARFDATRQGTPPGPDTPTAWPALPLHVDGARFVDAKGRRVRLAGVNWAGGHQERFVPSGLDRQTPAAIARALRLQGFNSVRLTYSDRMVRDEPTPPDDALAANPELKGKSPLAAFDAVVHALAAEGMLVILNNHMSDAAWCCSDTDGNGLWYNERFSEADWIANWVKLVRRYRDVPHVVGADLRNEPRSPATWGGDPATDWPAAAERCGAILKAENPDLLLLVEGVGYATNLTGVADRPVDLPDAHRAYSAHDYLWSIPGTLASTYDEYRMLADVQWAGLMTAPSPVPVWLGEFGCFHHDIGSKWWPWSSRLVRERSLDTAFWVIFAYDGETWGLLDPDTLEPADRTFAEALRTLAAPTPDVPDVQPAPGTAGPATVEWVPIPGGTLSMGGADLGPVAMPVHPVVVGPFRMSRTEVTVTQYAACEAAGACQPRAGIPQEPVDRWGAGVPTQWLTWDQAGAFCAWAGGRRCTEAEWEWAARNGPAGDPYPWGTKPPDCSDAVWTLSACPRAGPEPPCAREAGPWGLCDLAGNVLEWVEDDWHPTYAGAPADGTAWVDTPRAGKRVLRGGSYAHVFEDGIRSAWRDRANPGDSAAMFGARCCATFE